MADRAALPTEGSSPAPNTAEWAYQHLVELLAPKPWGRDSRVHPETRKIMERAAHWVVALAGLGPDPNGVPAARLATVLQGHSWLAVPRRPSDEQAWLLADSLEALWIESAADDAIEEEYARKAPETAEAGELTGQQKRVWLLSHHTESQRIGSRGRARVALRTRYLCFAGMLLMLLVGSVWALALIALDDDATIIFCALGGAIGGAVSGARGLRDSRRIHQARIFQTWWWVQPAVGGAVGLFVYALLISNVLTLPGSVSNDPVEQSAARIIYAFVAGFSEPWILGIMSRLSGAADNAATMAGRPTPDLPTFDTPASPATTKGSRGDGEPVARA
jgi:hypothetical protein